MTASSARRNTFLFCLAMPVLLLACPKKQPVVEEAGPPPAPTPDTGTLVIDIPELDAGGDADADAAKKPTGPGMNAVEAKIRTCCNLIRTQSKALPPGSAEGSALKVQADQCDAMAKQIGANPNAPEINALRSMFGGKFPGCSF